MSEPVSDPGLAWLLHLAGGTQTPLALAAADVARAVRQDGLWVLRAEHGLPDGWEPAWIYLADQLRQLGWTMVRQHQPRLYVAGPPVPLPDGELRPVLLGGGDGEGR